MKSSYKIYARGKGQLKLYIRISLKSLRAEICTGLYANNHNELDQNNYPIDRYKREQLQSIIDELKYNEKQLIDNESLIDPIDIINRYRGKETKGKLLHEMNLFIQKRESEVDRNELRKGTLKNFYTTQKHIKRFIDSYYKKDIPVIKFDLEFLDAFNNWMALNTDAKNNGRAKHIDRLKVFWKYLHYKGLIDKNPFAHFKIRKIPFEREFLSIEEIERLRHCIFHEKGLEHARDLFLFMCNTGLCYSDAQNINNDQFYTSNGMTMIKGNRQKSNSRYVIPLNEEALRIYDKYDGLPVFTNQVFNRRLKVIAKRVGINKYLTSHVARHSFACIAINDGIPVEVIQRVLGHKDLRMTMHYAKLADTRIVEEFKDFKIKSNYERKAANF